MPWQTPSAQASSVQTSPSLHGVSSGALGTLGEAVAAVGGDDGDHTGGGVHREVPAAFVDVLVVTEAQQAAVVDVRGAVMSSEADVVDLGPGGGTVTPGEAAAPVADRHGRTGLGRDGHHI